MLKAESVSHLFEEFNSKNIIVIGDVMLDSYLWGDVSRISPEAPVPVVDLKTRENRLGGAANVGLNLNAMGATTFLCSVIGNDTKADEYLDLMRKENLDIQGIIKSKERITTTKFRVIGNNHQMLRVDEEIRNPLSEKDRSNLVSAINGIIENNAIHGIIFQDYDKGVIDKSLIENIVNLAVTKNIPVSVDPKKNNFAEYNNVTLFKPNLKEIKEGLNIEFDSSDFNQIEKAVEKLQKELNVDIVFNTLSEKGVFIRWKTEDGFDSKHIPAHLRNISDVSGAGDTVISLASLCLACKIDMVSLARISNLAGGLVCEEPGVVPIDKSKLQNELISLLS